MRRAAAVLARTSAVVGLLVLGSVTAGASSTSGHPATVASDGGSPTWSPDPTVDTQPPVIPATVPVGTVRTWLAGALELRAEELGALQASLAAANGVPDAVRASLASDLSTAVAGIDGLSAGLSKDTTLVALRADAGAMVTTYRVFSVVEPQVHLALEAERQLAVGSQIAHLRPALQTAIKTEQNLKASGTLTSLATALGAGLTSLQGSASGVVTDLLSQDPGNYTEAAAAVTADTKAVANGWSIVGTVRSDVGRILSLLAGQS